MRIRGTAGIGLALVVAVAAVLALPAFAQAAFGIKTWEAANCRSDSPRCSYASPASQLFTQVGGHPDLGIFNFAFNTVRVNGNDIPEGTIRDIRVDLPPGFAVNPQAAPTCTEAELEAPLVGEEDGKAICERKGAEVGTVILTVVANPGGRVSVIETEAGVFNISPKAGEPAELGFRIDLPGVFDVTTYLEATVAWEGDYHEGVTIRQVDHTFHVASARIVLDGHGPRGSFLTVGTDCQGSTASAITVDSYEDPTARLRSETAPLGPGNVLPPSGCEAVPFDPAMTARASTDQVDSPTGLGVDLHFPLDPAAPVAQANLRRAVVTLPAGMGLNPAAAQGLGACTDQQLGGGIAIGDRIADPAGVHPPPLECPPASEIGTVAIETPLLPAGSLAGKLYLGRQLSREPASGREYRVFLDAEAPALGVYVRLQGEIAADPTTGRLTASFDEPAHGGLPQVPLSSLRLSFDEERGLLSTPPTCGPQELTSRLSPWTGSAPATPSASFALESAPGGRSCAAVLAARPFAPTLTARLDDHRGGAYSPLSLAVTRAAGEQELKVLDLTLPAGASAKLAGVPYCPEPQIAAAASRAGAEEAAQPSCPAQSQIGRVEVGAGTGPVPLTLAGKAYLAGPYGGAKLSLVAVVPALAGPFDLGTVVVRAPLGLDPETAQIHTTASLPDVYGGAKLDLRSVSVALDRPGFMRNPTNCAAGALAGSVRGGGADPAQPAAFSSVAVSSALQAQGCAALRFAPRLSLRLTGATHRASHPKLAVSLKARAGDANIARASVALPHALFLDQASLGRICSRAQFAAGQCPRASVYGFARASSPLLDKPLEGPVYLRSSTHELPDLVAHLQGQVDVDLVGRIDSFRGGIRTRFERVPDLPVSKFAFTLPGGKHGLLVSSTDLCASPVRALVALTGQNGRKANSRPRVGARCRRRR